MVVKLSRIMFVVLSMISILSAGCAPPAPGHHYETAEDGSSASVLPASVQDLKKLSWEVGPEAYYFRYKEEGFMVEEGMFYGVHLGATLRNWLPSSPEQSAAAAEAMDIAFYKLMLRVEGRFAVGEVDYRSQSGSINNVNDRSFETRLLVGPDFPLENTLITFFTGAGYRYLHDDLREYSVTPLGVPAGYERESRYLYVPLGVETTSQLGDGWSGGVSGEVDFFLWGNQRSHISSSSDQLVDNYQPRGYGLRFSARLEKKGDKADLIIEPFFRFWEVNESEISDGIFEPTNSTIEGGVRVMLGL
jgi:hypothetical protein